MQIVVEFHPNLRLDRLHVASSYKREIRCHHSSVIKKGGLLLLPLVIRPTVGVKK